MESAETAQRRAALDLAIIGVLADGGLRRSEAADLTWGDVELWPDGTGRLTVQKGKNMRRPAWTQLREMLWPGDVVVVPRIDRLAGNLAEEIRTVQYLHDQGIYIRALPKGLDTGDDNPTSKLMLHMLLSLAEWERETIWGRIQAGVDRAAAEGRTGGRPPALDSEKTQAVRDFLEGSRSVSAAARTFNVSRATIRAVRDWTCTTRTGETNVDRR